MALVELDNVSRVFDGSPPVTALSNVSCSISEGEFAVITGPSGSGKSTLLNVLGLLDRPSSGQYLFDGKDVSESDEAERAGIRSAHIGFVFQSFHLIAERTSVENVALGGLYRRGGHLQRKSRAIEALDRVGLGLRLEAKPTTLSGGEKQRVAIARAIIGSPKLLLADEPTGNLDTKTGGRVLDLFYDLNRQGLTVVLITHDLAVASQIRRRYRLEDGHLRSSLS